MPRGWVSIPVVAVLVAAAAACSKPEPENPFKYGFVNEVHLSREAGAPYSDFKAFYLLTEDFEPVLSSASDVEDVRGILKFAGDLSERYGVPWTHFVDANVLAPAYISTDPAQQRQFADIAADLGRMTAQGDDCQLHLHGSLRPELVERMKAREKIHPRRSNLDKTEGYRLRRSFFFNSVYLEGYLNMVRSLSYGKRFLEETIYGEKSEVLAFRPGGWDHGSSASDAFLYFCALNESGIAANSGLASGTFNTPSYWVGNKPGANLARVKIGSQEVLEVSPTTGPGGYLNPAIEADLNSLAKPPAGEIQVIVSVFHLGALQHQLGGGTFEEPGSEATIVGQNLRGSLEKHFQSIAELRSRKVLYPITLRGLLAVVAASRHKS